MWWSTQWFVSRNTWCLNDREEIAEGTTEKGDQWWGGQSETETMVDNMQRRDTSG